MYVLVDGKINQKAGEALVGPRDAGVLVVWFKTDQAQWCCGAPKEPGLDSEKWRWAPGS